MTPKDQRYLAFLESCIAGSDKEHSPEELAEAEKILREAVHVPQFDLLLGGQS